MLDDAVTLAGNVGVPDLDPEVLKASHDRVGAELASRDRRHVTSGQETQRGLLLLLAGQQTPSSQSWSSSCPPSRCDPAGAAHGADLTKSNRKIPYFATATWNDRG